MKIVITGGAGCIGSRLAARLLSEGREVWAVDDLSLGSRDNLEPNLRNPRLHFVAQDVCAPAFASLLQEVRPQRVFLLAANSDISKGSSDPRVDLERSFLTTFHTLEAMRLAGTREAIFASTSAIYGEVAGNLREEHGPLEPISFYGAAKLAGEAYVSAYCRLYDLRAWVFRFPNVVGPNLTHGAVHDFVRRLYRDRDRLAVLGNGTQTKPYIHVDDLLEAILLASAQPAQPVATFNIAGDGATSVREIAEMVREALQLPGATIEYGVGDRGWPGDVPSFSYDTSRIRALGWTPVRSSREAVRAAIESEVARCRHSS